ncbi:MAG: hypothetical protein COT73_01595 [Bdellovibrio sp. CG10_big_fil_rev_8_21_14_0_10_47_8]|nr:MAG: hypothetical protein COT73_01595 [Bdellovibrio sp. CG10_big_fil_rev_8_21_14_0_10_47_8]
MSLFTVRNFLSCLVFIFSLLSVHSAKAVGFGAGDQFSATLLVGDLMVYCRSFEGFQVAHFSCRGDLLEPTNQDYFYGPQGLTADKVFLTATREDGSQKNKSSKYDSQKGRSKDRFNLWIWTLLQKPLLDDGRNMISYEFKKGNQSVAQGQLVVTVSRMPSKQCPSGSYNSGVSQDCENQITSCDRYFAQNNYCQ